MNRFQFVADHQRRYGVKRLCAILGIARSNFYYWRETAVVRAARQAVDAKFAVRIRTVHRSLDGIYGVPRITAELRENGEEANHKRIARVMESDRAGRAPPEPQAPHRRPDPAAAKVPDLIGRDFTADRTNTKYVGDITYLSLAGGKFRYLATVIDLASRRLAGGRSPTTCGLTSSSTPCMQPNGSATASSAPFSPTITGHSTCSRAFADVCREAGVSQSMSAIGSSADNALSVSFNVICKQETFQGRWAWDTERKDLDLFCWLHCYNTARRHSRPGHHSAIAYERALRTTSNTLTEAS
ncbi:IS3 family transposase [Streptomyces sp. CAS3]